MPLRNPPKAVIMNSKTGEYKEFQFNPTPIDEEHGVDYARITAPGLPHPFFQYVGGHEDEISFEINLDDKGMWKGYTHDFIKFLNKFRPTIEKHQFQSPPPLILAYGRSFIRTGILEGISVEKNRFHSDTLMVARATATLEIISLPAEDKGSMTKEVWR